MLHHFKSKTQTELRKGGMVEMETGLSEHIGVKSEIRIFWSWRGSLTVKGSYTFPISKCYFKDSFLG